MSEVRTGALLLRSSDLSLVRELRKQEADVGQFQDVTFSADGQFAAAGSTGDWADKGGVVKIWRTSDGSLIRTLGPLSGQAAHVEFSPDGRLLACADDNVYKGDTAKLWQVSDGKLLRRYDADFFITGAVAFSPDGSLLAFPGKDGMQVLRVADGGVVRLIEARSDHVDFTPDGSSLLLMDAFSPGLYRLSDGTRHRAFRPTGYVSGQAISRDGALVAAGGADGWIDVWRVVDSSKLRRIKAVRDHDFVRGLDFSPDGTLLASTSYDVGVHLWRIA